MNTPKPISNTPDSTETLVTTQVIETTGENNPPSEVIAESVPPVIDMKELTLIHNATTKSE